MPKFELDENSDLNSIKEQVERMRVGADKARGGTEKMRVGNDSARVTINRPQLLGPRTKAIFTGVLAAVLVVLVACLAFALLHRPPVTSHKVPNLVGKGVAEAKKALLDLGLNVRTNYKPASQKPAGTVEATNPVAGTSLHDGEPVTLMVAGKAPETAATTPTPTPGPGPGPGPAPTPGPGPGPNAQPSPPTGDDKTAMPDVVEMTESKAHRTLEALGCKVVETTANDSAQADKIVLGCDPKPGEKLAKGALVHLIVNARVDTGTAPRANPSLVALRNYAGMRGPAVVEALTTLGLVPTLKPIVSQNQPSGFVIETDPPANSQLPRGAHVTVVVAQ